MECASRSIIVHQGDLLPVGTGEAEIIGEIEVNQGYDQTQVIARMVGSDECFILTGVIYESR